MAPKRKRAGRKGEARQAEGSESDDAPVELSNALSKSEAVTKRMEEREARKSSLKKKKGGFSQPEVVEDETEKPEEREDTGVLRKEGPNATGEDLLPLDIIQKLAEKQQSAQKQAPAKQAQPQEAQQKRPKQRLLEVQRGPVQVKVLAHKAASAPSVSAAAFKTQKLQGDKVHRSHTMLAPPRAYHSIPAPRFAS